MDRAKAVREHFEPAKDLTADQRDKLAGLGLALGNAAVFIDQVVPEGQLKRQALVLLLEAKMLAAQAVTHHGVSGKGGPFGS